MTQPYIPSFGFKDPNDRRPKNFDFYQVSLDAGHPGIDAFDVDVTAALDADGESIADDGELEITDIAWDETTKRVSFRWQGGTLGWKYLLTARIAAGSTFSADQSAWVTIANK